MRPLILLSTVLTLTAALTLPVAAIPVGGTVRTAGGGPVADAAVELRPLLRNYHRAGARLAVPPDSPPAPLTDAELLSGGVFGIASSPPTGRTE